MEALLAALEATSWAQALRTSRWGYAALSTAHVLGLAILVGAIVPLDLRLLGVRTGVSTAVLTRVLAPMAAAGLALTIVTGGLLFSVRAREYAGLVVLQAKLMLVVVGTISALIAHLRHGPTLETASRSQLAAHGAISIACWLGALVCGRMIAFAGE